MLLQSALSGRPTRSGRYVLVLLLAALAGATGHSRARAQEPPGLLSDDPRLSVKIVVQAQGVPVSDLVAQIAAASGVVLTADSETKDDKIIVFGPARPLYAVLNDVAALFGDVWTTAKTPTGKLRYRLTRARATLRLENSLLAQSRTRMMDALDKQVNALSETPDQLKQRAANDPIRSILSNPDGRAATQFYGLLTPARQQALFEDGQTESFPFTALTPAQQQPLRDWFARYTAHLQEYASKVNSPNTLVPIPTQQDFERGTVGFTLSGEGGQDTGIRLQIGKATLLLRQFPAPQRVLLPPHGNPYTGRSLAANSVLPDVARIHDASVADDWRDRLHKLADLAQISVMADYYRVPLFLNVEDAAQSQTDASDIAALDTLCRPAAYLWWLQGKTLLFRKREWVIVRQFEAPDSWTRELEKSIAANKGEPTYADLLRLTQLTPRQINGLEITHGVAESQANSLPPLLAIVEACLLNAHKTLPTQPVFQPATQTYTEPAEAQALIYNGPAVPFEPLRRYVAHLPTAPDGLSGAKIKMFYSYPLLANPQSPTHKALMAVQKRQQELQKSDVPDEEDSKRLSEEYMRLLLQDNNEMAVRNTADGRFVYVNLTAVLLHKQDDPATVRESGGFQIPLGQSFTMGSRVLLSDLSEFPSTFQYHVILPRTLPNDRSSRTRIEVTP